MYHDGNYKLVTTVPGMIRATIERVARRDERTMARTTKVLIEEALRARGELPTE
jgi:hypothetical protein